MSTKLDFPSDGVEIIQFQLAWIARYNKQWKLGAIVFPNVCHVSSFILSPGTVKRANGTTINAQPTKSVESVFSSLSHDFRMTKFST